MTGTGPPEQNRWIGRNTSLLLLINPGAGGRTDENRDLVAEGERGGAQHR
jgi:hypothetical protein